MAGKVENKKFEEYENENYYLLWWSEKRQFRNNCLGFSDEDDFWLPSLANFLVILGSQHPFSFNFYFMLI